MNRVLLTGSQGFIGSYLCNELLRNGYNVTGVDNFSKYGFVKRPHDDNPQFELIQLDCSKDTFTDSLKNRKFDYIIAGAAMIGGISYFHKYAYDLLATNERILANTFDLAKEIKPKRVVIISSSMVFENVNKYPTPEYSVKTSPPPLSTYGFQKLSCEYFAKGAWEQYGIPYTIVRPFNCVGVGEEKSIKESSVTSGNIKLMMSHVVPDLINKCLKGQNPLHILGDGNQIRCYTNGRDIARGIRLAMESKDAINEDFNISTSTATTVLELAKMIWDKINTGKKFNYVCDKPFEYDVQKRIPDVKKARNILNFEGKTSLNESLDEVIEWMKLQQDHGDLLDSSPRMKSVQ